jgi:hypothetical protein
MEIQQVEQKKKEQLMREILLGMNDRAFDKLFTEPANFDNKTGANFRVTI